MKLLQFDWKFKNEAISKEKEAHARFTLDVALIPALQARTHLPILVDPSHAAGDRRLVVPLARAALAADADGLIVEAHPCPTESACDARQALNFDDFEALMREIEYPPFITTAALAAEVPAWVKCRGVVSEWSTPSPSK